MKKALILVFALLLITGALSQSNPYIETQTQINQEIEESGLEIIFLEETYTEPGFSLYDSGQKKLYVGTGLNRLALDIQSLFLNSDMLSRLSQELKPTEILVNLTTEGFSVIIFSKNFGEETQKNIITITSVDSSKETSIFFGAREFVQSQNFWETQEPRVLITEHYSPDLDVTNPDRENGIQRLAAVSNGKSELIIDNGGIIVKKDSESRFKIKVSTLFGLLSENREIDFISLDGERIVFEFVTGISDNLVKIVVRFSKDITLSLLKDRFYSSSNQNEVPIEYDDEEWVSVNPFDPELEGCINEGSFCKLATENTGDSLVNCFCTRIDGAYKYRNSENTLCDVPQNQIASVSEPEKPDFLYGCCDGTLNCGLKNFTNSCEKFGFFLIPGYGSGDANLARIKEFTGGKGFMLLNGFVNSEPNSPGSVDNTAYMVKKAYELGIIPVVRLLGPDWETTTPTAEEMASWVYELFTKTNGKLEFIQVWNEPNARLKGNEYFKDPSIYAEYVIDIKNLIAQKGLSSIKIISAALSPGEPAEGRLVSSYSYMETLFGTPNFLESIDYWAHHSYSETDPEAETGKCDEDIRLPQYTGKTCGEGILGYRYDLNQIRKKTDKDIKVILTEFGYRHMNELSSQGINSPEYKQKREYMIKSMDIIKADSYVEGAIIFLLNGQDEQWWQDSWLSSTGEALLHMKDIASAACSNNINQEETTPSIEPKECQTALRDYTYESDCTDGTYFKYDQCLPGLNITDARPENGCYFESVSKLISCQEIVQRGLQEGKIYVRVLNEEKKPINTEIIVKLGDQEQVTRSIAYFPTCENELEDLENARSGFAEFSFSDEYETQELFVDTESADYDFPSDKLTFNIGSFPLSQCTDQTKHNSIYIRFIKKCSQ